MLALFKVQHIYVYMINKTDSVAFSPQTNYTDWTIAAGRRILLTTSTDREMSRGQRGGAHGGWSRISGSIGTATFLSSSSSFILTRAECTPFQTHCYSENMVATGIEPGTSELAARNSNLQWPSYVYDIKIYLQVINVLIVFIEVNLLCVQTMFIFMYYVIWRLNLVLCLFCFLVHVPFSH
jgi:hypothetical protein